MNKCYFIIHQLYLQVAAGCHQFPLVVVEVPMVEVAMMLMVELFVSYGCFCHCSVFLHIKIRNHRQHLTTELAELPVIKIIIIV